MKTATGYYTSRRKGISNPISTVVTVGACLACWISSYLLSPPLTVLPDTLVSGVWRQLWASREVAYGLGLIVLSMACLLIQRGTFLLLIQKGRNALPLLFFLLLTSTNPQLLPLRPVSVAAFFLFVALFQLFSAYQEAATVGGVFNATLALVAGSMLWPPLLLLLPVYWYGLYRFHTFNLRFWFASLLAVFTALLAIVSWCLWVDDFFVLHRLWQTCTTFGSVLSERMIWVEWVMPLVGIATLGLLAFLSAVREPENSLRTRDYQSFLIVFGVYSFVCLLLFGERHHNDWLFIFNLPLSILAARFFSRHHGRMMAILYYSVIVVALLLFLLQLWNI